MANDLLQELAKPQVEKTMRLFAQIQSLRATFASQWEEAAELILPEAKNTFYYGDYNWPGQKKTERQIDATGMMALHRFAAICDSLLTPRNMFWHSLGPNHAHLMKSRRVKEWFEAVTKILFRLRYSPFGNFSAQNQAFYTSLGAFGTGGMFVDSYSGLHGERAIRYKNIPLGQMFIIENHQGIVREMIRWFRMTPDQAVGKWKDNVPECIKTAYDQRSQTPYNFLHHVCLREDWVPSAILTPKGKPYASYYMCVEGQHLCEEGGYWSFPYQVGRYMQASGEVYGRGPAQMVLPALKTLNAEKKVFLKSGHRAADPIILTADDGLVDFDMRPGSINKGGMNSDGKPLVGVLPTGPIQITLEMMQEERQLINDAFLVSLFQVLTETPTMTATEVIERTNEKGILLAPTVGRQQSEYIGPLVERELDLASQMRLLPPMPPELKEVGGEYAVEYTSPLARAMRAQEAAGFMRTVDMAKDIVSVTQDTSIMDSFDFDTAIPAIAEIQSVPVTWMTSPEKLAQKRQARGAAAQQQAQIQAAPSAAALLKAHAAIAQAGGPAQPFQGGGGAAAPAGPPPQQGQVPTGPDQQQGA